jgi:hypothetical protein
MSRNELRSQVVEKDALYYPYIHIRSVDWLKRALLIFPHVARIVPRNFQPADRPEVLEFENVVGRRNKPLLRKANLNSGGVHHAQRLLLNLLANDFRKQPELLKKFGSRYSENYIKSENDEFLLHEDKPLYELVSFLEDNQLMWPARYGNNSADTAVHPIIGQTIMSTIAMACAKDEGFDVVTDEGRIHYELSEGDVESLYRSLLRTNIPASKKFKASDRELCELIVFQQCDVAALTPERLGELSQDRKAIDDFRSALAEIAATIPEMQDTVAFNDRLKDAVNDALHAWKSDRMNMSKVSKEMFGSELLKPTEGFIKNLAEKFAPPAIGAVGGALSGAGESSVLVGAAGGFIVALLFHGLTSLSKAVQSARQSPYRYLTKIEKAGVAFTVTR